MPAGSEVCLRRMRTWNVAAVGLSRLDSVWFDAEKPRVDESVEHPLPQGPLTPESRCACSPVQRRPGIPETRHVCV